MPRKNTKKQPTGCNLGLWDSSLQVEHNYIADILSRMNAKSHINASMEVMVIQSFSMGDRLKLRMKVEHSQRYLGSVSQRVRASPGDIKNVWLVLKLGRVTPSEST